MKINFDSTLQILKTLDSESNNIYINYSIPHYDNVVSKKYSYKLIGWSNSWSDWQAESHKYSKTCLLGVMSLKLKGK